MSATTALFLRTLVIGVAVAAPVGAMGVLCIQRTLAGGLRAGLATGLGIATADAVYASLAAFGVTAVTASVVAWQAPLRIVGGVALVWLGVSAITSRPVHERTAGTVVESEPWMLYTSAVGLTLTNPMTVMAFAAVFASSGLSVEGPAGAFVATLGVLCGSLAWWIGLSATVSVVRHAAGDTAVRAVNAISGLVVALFGAAAILSGVGLVR